MCGIVGIASVVRTENRSWLSAGRDAMLHRGPDDFGEWWSADGQIGLAHRRLAILDLSPAGHQPMHDAARHLTIVFNGEIYNFLELRLKLESSGYVFSSHSDTEVILAAYSFWGEDCVAQLNGMFSFALYDSLRKVLLLARDRAGEKPLFYHYKNGTLRFGSELKALLADNKLPRHINASALDCYLTVGFVPGAECILRDFNKLPPAHALLFDVRSGLMNIWQYWKLPEFSESLWSENCNASDLVDDFESLLEDAVRRQMVADVPVGVLLSGGVDSSLITAMAVRASNKVQTFTIGFPGHQNLDESKHARLISQYFGTEHTELMADSTDADLLIQLARQFDEPVVDSSMIPTFLVSRLVRQHCTVALGGDGGDELFGGYSSYSRLLWMQNRLGRYPLWMRKAIASCAERWLPVGLKGRNWLLGLAADTNSDGLPLIATYFDARSRRKLLAKYGEWKTTATEMLANRIPLGSDLLQRATRMDFNNYLPEDILVKVDRSSMINSLEVRSPLLDFRIIEFAFQRVPSNLKATVSNKKIFLKMLTERLLPIEFDRTRKQGFSIPLSAWLKGGSIRQLFYHVLQKNDCTFDQKTVTELLKGQDAGRNNGERLFAMVMFELWRSEYGVSL